MNKKISNTCFRLPFESVIRFTSVAHTVIDLLEARRGTVHWQPYYDAHIHALTKDQIAYFGDCTLKEAQDYYDHYEHWWLTKGGLGSKPASDIIAFHRYLFSLVLNYALGRSPP